MELTFDESVSSVVELAVTPSNDEKLHLYGLYKQSTIGDINIDAPSFFDFAGSAKWKSWDSHKGKPTEIAKQDYISLVKTLIDKYGRIETLAL